MILVTGATGNIGRELVDLLLARGQDVRALTRHPERSDLPGVVETVRGETSDEQALGAALDGVEAVFLNVFGDVEPVARAVDGSSARRVVLLSTLSAGTRPELAEAARYRDLERRVREVRADAVVLRPGQFMSNTMWWAPMIAEGAVATPFADVAVPMIDPADIAAVAAEVLVDDRRAGTTLGLTGAEAPTPRERVATLAEVLGRPIAVSELTEQQFRDASPYIPAAGLDYLLALTGHPTEEEQHLLGTVEEITGRPPRGFRDWVESHRDDLLAAAR